MGRGSGGKAAAWTEVSMAFETHQVIRQVLQSLRRAISEGARAIRITHLPELGWKERHWEGLGH